MVTLTFKPYVPKPLKDNIRKPISKSISRQPNSLDKSFQINSNGVPIGVPPALGGAAGSNDWCQKAVGDSETIVQDTQVSRDDLAGTRAASIAEKDASDNYTDNDFPPLTHPPPPKYKHISAEERPSIKNTTEKSNDQALGDNLFSPRGWRAPGSYDEPIELGSDNTSKGDDSNLDTGHARRIVDSGQLGSDAFILEFPPALSNRTANEHNDGYNGIDNKSPRIVKRQRSASPPGNSLLHRASTPPPPHNEDGKSSKGNIDHSDPNEIGYDDVWSKRRKVSASLGGSISLHNSNGPSRSIPAPIAEDDGDDGTDSISTDSNLASTARTTPAFEDSPRAESQLCPQVIDADRDWEVRQIIGKEDIDGVLHYLVDWYPTLLPEHSLGHAKEMVDKFEAQLRAQREVKNGRGAAGVKRGERAVVEANASGGQEQKRPRGRPRKQA